MSLKESYLELDFDVKVDDTKDRLLARVNLGPSASFSERKLSTSSGKAIEN